MAISVGYVYLTINLINGKRYIGQHKSEKFDIKYKGSGTKLQKALKEYGWDNFKCIILEWCSSLEELNDAEIRYIERNNAVGSREFYNMVPGGHRVGHTVSKETRDKIGDRLRGMKHSEVSRKNMSLGREGLKLSKEHRENISKGNIGKRHTEEMKRYLSVVNTGKRRTEETKRKIREVNTGKVLTEEIKLKIKNKSIFLNGSWQKEKAKKMVGDKHPLSHSILCVETCVEFETVTQAANVMGLNRRAIHNALNTGGRSGGYHWQTIKNKKDGKVI